MKRGAGSLRRGVLVLGVLAGLAGLGGAVAAEPREAISVRLPMAGYDLLMREGDVTGLAFQLSRLPGELRGRVGDVTVALQLKDGQVKGTLGSSPVNLDVKKEGDVLNAKGGFWGRPVTLKLSPQELTVYVRDCTYRLKATEPGRTYEGRRSCDASLRPPSVVSLPDMFLAASPEEQASLLLLAL
ncbi:hypothetical protein G4177_19340 [Corallococcus sp. ZKHCc1 1396]|uniref:Uncharacterized protein n=1 Tax=Corallococcus soli TaxID=2710757 RepID=A0ABR9PR29_9BACT|nr:hypothetical protein [Corallococcus soli]MBE4750324.1 hypothetical protein [Corallococcus soli]